MHKPSAKLPERPAWSVIIGAILVVFQILFAYRVLIDNGVAPEQLSLAPVVQALIALLWACLFSDALRRIWRQYRTATQWFAWLLICFFSSRLLQTAWFVQADYHRNRFAFQVAVTLLILIVPAGYLLRQRQQRTPE